MLTRLLPLLLLSLSLATAPSCKKDKPSSSTDDKREATASADNAEASADAAPAAPAAKVIERPFFYKVTGPKGEHGYLLGTYHMGVEAKDELPKPVWDAFASATTIAIEADVTDVSAAKSLMLPPDQNLEDLVGPEAWQLIVDRYGKTIAMMIRPMRPAGAISLLMMQDLPQTTPMELYMLAEANKGEKSIEYLEEVQFQIDLLNDIMTTEYLVFAVKNAKKEDMEKLLEIYRTGDDTRLMEEMTKPEAWGGDDKAEINRKRMLDDRNANWVEPLKALYGKGDAFVAVGAAHLFGDTGVIKLLTSDGYTFTRIDAKGEAL